MIAHQGYVVYTDQGRFKKIKYEGKGTVPDVLKGLYTTDSEAIKAIDRYVSTLPKGKQNVPSEGNG